MGHRAEEIDWGQGISGLVGLAEDVELHLSQCGATGAFKHERGRVRVPF